RSPGRKPEPDTRRVEGRVLKAVRVGTQGRAPDRRCERVKACVAGDLSMANSVLLGTHHFLQVGIRNVAARQAAERVTGGWDDLRQIGAASIAHGALITALGGVLLMLGSSHAYLVAAAISGYLLVGPIMTTGLCELSRRRAAGEPVGFDESLQG